MKAAATMPARRVVAWRHVLALALCAGCHTAPAGALGNSGPPGATSATSAAPAASLAAESAPSVAGPECAGDVDCVPATCCHATACVPRSAAPACQGIMCTKMCVPHSIDCGGGCFCQSGRCSARLFEQPAQAPR
jgi:hypothetical protein